MYIPKCMEQCLNMLAFLKSLLKKYREHRERMLFPEKQIIVKFDDEGVKATRPDGTIEIVTWSELKKIEVYTTDEGPFVEDVFFVLHGDNRGCCIPQGAANAKDLIERLQNLPGFDNENFIKAMGSTSNNTFLIWEKTDRNS
jgi:hypothetical protein